MREKLNIKRVGRDKGEKEKGRAYNKKRRGERMAKSR